MKEIYSNVKDCRELRKLLSNKMNEREWNRITFDGYFEIIKGKYYSFSHSYYYDKELSRDDDSVTFSIKYCKNEILRLSVGEEVYPQTMGHKLAVLSDFYQVLVEKFGEPTLFYTLKEDEEKTLNMQWSFTNKDIDIQNFQTGTAFDDAEIDDFILFTEKNSMLQEITRQNNVNEIGLPIELIPLMEDNIEEFVKYKQGRKIVYPKNYQNGTLETREKKLLLK